MSVLTLDQRRAGPRAHNEYVDGPSPRLAAALSITTNQNQQPPSVGNPTIKLPIQNQTRRTGGVIHTQPPATPLKKDVIQVLTSEIDLHGGSIICKNCHKCKCTACTQPRELPSQCCCRAESAKASLEKCSCLCCIKGFFYHYAKDSEQDADVMCSDDPCACTGRPQCAKRWMCMTLASLCLPCLCLYWPGRCVIKSCTELYVKCSTRGCQCQTSKRPMGGSSTLQTRHLLLPVESDSSSA